ncbi:MAG: cyclase family protein [Verrucomicrobiota bacterium]
MQIFDISRTLRNDLAPWPGDTPFQFELKWKMTEGATVNVGAVNMSAHNGTHADAPFHFDPTGQTIEQIELHTYIGDAVVVDLSKILGSAEADRPRQITVADLATSSALLEKAPRLLLKTEVWKNSRIFPDWIPVIANDVPEWLRKRKVKLLGLDLPSVDTIDSKDLTNHHALAAAGVAIVESLDLSEVDEGIYGFAALPLKMAGGDAAPVRAILWRK